MSLQIWGPPHVDVSEIVDKINDWIETHPDHPIRSDLLQDLISSQWPMMWHLKVEFQINIDKRLAKSQLKENSAGQSFNICSICHNELRGGIETLACSHIFHTMCIHRWIQTSATCPMCRTNIQ